MAPAEPPPIISLKTLVFGLIIAWVVFAILGALATRRLLVVDVENGKIVRARGKVPKEVYAEVVDVLERTKASGYVEVRIVEGAATLIAKGGITDVTKQRLRNVIGRFPLQRLRSGGRIRQG